MRIKKLKPWKFLASLLILISCQKDDKVHVNHDSIQPIENVKTTTLDNRNLGFYIDSSRSSKAHQRVTERVLNPDTEELFLVQVHLYKGQYYLYDRCNGQIPIVLISPQRVSIAGTDSFIEYEIFKQDIKTQVSRFYLKVKSNLVNEGLLILEHTSNKDVYTLELISGNNEGKAYFTTFSKIKKFNTLIDACENGQQFKVPGFTDPQLNNYE